MNELTQAFVSFHMANRDVFYHIHRIAVSAANMGQKKIGINAVYEMVRWHADVGGSSPKMSNDYKPYYARLLLCSAKKSGVTFPPSYIECNVSDADTVEFYQWLREETGEAQPGKIIFGDDFQDRGAPMLPLLSLF